MCWRSLDQRRASVGRCLSERYRASDALRGELRHGGGSLVHLKLQGEEEGAGREGEGRQLPNLFVRMGSRDRELERAHPHGCHVFVCEVHVLIVPFSVLHPCVVGEAQICHATKWLDERRNNEGDLHVKHQVL